MSLHNPPRPRLSLLLSPSPSPPLSPPPPLLILDGAMGTELERRGVPLVPGLWSAAALLTHPEEVGQVHLDYLAAGATIITTCSYQATPLMYEKMAPPPEDPEAAILSSVTVALGAIERFEKGERVSLVKSVNGSVSASKSKSKSLRSMSESESAASASASASASVSKSEGEIALESLRHHFIAASIASYGAYLPSGGEFTGEYEGTVANEELKEFHRTNVRVLGNHPDVDCLFFETFPLLSEALLVLSIAKQECPQMPLIFSFTCRNGSEIGSGVPFAEVVEALSSDEQVVAIGINCTAPEYVTDLLVSAQSVRGARVIPFLVSPNSGEIYDGDAFCWVGKPTSETGFLTKEILTRWSELGVRIIGGCCRTQPSDTRLLQEKISQVRV